MNQLAVIGASWRHVEPSALSGLTLASESRADRLPGIAEQIQATELVYLATCNRVEVALTTDQTQSIPECRRRLLAALTGREPQPGEAERLLRAWRDEGAIEHLFLLVSGLDSARLGEGEIAGQVSEAFNLSREIGLLGPQLELIFELSRRVSRKVRGRTGIGSGSLSLSEIAVHETRRRLRRTPGRVALFGVSPMTTRCARELAADGVELLIVNRTLQRAQELGREVGGRGVSLRSFRERPIAVEVLVLATGSPQPILERCDLERLAALSASADGPLVLDLAVPADVRPQDAEAVGLQRIGMDEITREVSERRDQQELEAAEARMLVDEAVERARQKLNDRMLAPLFAAIQKQYRRTAFEGVERLLRRPINDLGELDREAIRLWAETLARRFAHLPVLGLRGLANHAGADTVRAFVDALASYDADLAQELRDAAGYPESFRSALEETEL